MLIDSYPDALHLQNDDGMTPLDLALADESASETVVAMLEGRPPPPELSRRQKAEKFVERAEALERKLGSVRDVGGRQYRDLREAIQAVRRLADRFPHALYSAGIDPNELEIALSGSMGEDVTGGESVLSGNNHGGKLGNNSTRRGIRLTDAENVILEAVKKRSASGVVPHNQQERPNSHHPNTSRDNSHTNDGVKDQVESLLASIVSVDHIKSQVRGLRRSTEIADLRESLIPPTVPATRVFTSTTLLAPALSDDSSRPRSSHMVFIGNPGTGKSAVARLLAKTYHELGILRKPRFLEVERMDLVGRTPAQTTSKTLQILEEAKGGILFIDEAYTLSMATKRSKSDAGLDAIKELVRVMDGAVEADQDDMFPLVILAGFPQEMQNFLASQGGFRKRFALTFEFPDYTCTELAQIFVDLCYTKGFELDDSLDVKVLSELLERETTVEWRGERNGRVCEFLLTGARTEVRKRIRSATFDDIDVDPQLIILSDVENVMMDEFK